MEFKKNYTQSNAIIYFIIAFALAYGLQFAGIYTYSYNLILYQILIAVSMFAPLIAVLISHKGLGNAKTGINWKVNFKRNWKWFIVAFISPAIFTALGAILYFAVFPDKFDPSMNYIAAIIPEGTDLHGITIPMLAAISIIEAVTYAPLINMFFAIGEEVGWRGYMTPMLSDKLGKKSALILGGIIWGAWHWPLIICVGYNYGTGYFGAPFTGMLTMCVMTTIVGILLSYLYDKSQCIWVPALAHGAMNAVSSAPFYFADSSSKGYLLGPALTGLIPIIPIGIVAVIIFFTHRITGNSAIKMQ